MKQVTRVAKPQERKWHIISARDQILGRLATKVVQLLMGKYKRDYTPNADMGDYVVITDAKNIVLTGKKMLQKRYQRYSGYPGGLKEIPIGIMLEKHTERVIRLAVAGMLPDNRLKKNRLARLKIFVGSEHTYEAKLKVKS